MCLLHSRLSCCLLVRLHSAVCRHHCAPCCQTMQQSAVAISARHQQPVCVPASCRCCVAQQGKPGVKQRAASAHSKGPSCSPKSWTASASSAQPPCSCHQQCAVTLLWPYLSSLPAHTQQRWINSREQSSPSPTSGQPAWLSYMSRTSSSMDTNLSTATAPSRPGRA